MKPVSGLRADFLPQRHWPLRSWFYGRPLWAVRYYHGPRQADSAWTSERFYELVDPDLRDLCRMAHEAGLTTTPSCQGHFHGRSHFERAWRQMQREAELIRSKGLVVTNVETGEQHLFRDGAYDLPWPNFAAFHEQSLRHAGRGYLGLLVRPDRADLWQALDDARADDGALCIEWDAEVGRRLGGVLLVLEVRASSRDQRSGAWAKATTRVREAVSAGV